MTKVKEASTNNSNKTTALFTCPVTYTLAKIGGRWKPLIIYNLLPGPKRYGELKRLIPAITEKMLIQHLKELEADQLVSRKALAVVPPARRIQLNSRRPRTWPRYAGNGKLGFQTPRPRRLRR